MRRTDWMTGMQERRTLWWWGIVLIMHGAWLLYALTRAHYVHSDSVGYLQAADNLLRHGTRYAGDQRLPYDPALLTQRPPLYPIFLLLTGGGWGFRVGTLVAQNMLSLMSIGIAVRLARRLGAPERVRWGVLPLLVFTPAQFIYANALMSEVLFQALLTLAFYAFVRYVEVGGWRIGWAHALLGLAILTKPVLYLATLPNVGVQALLSRQRRDRRPLLAALGLVGLVLSYAGWNAATTGLFHVSSIQNTNLLRYNARAVLLRTEGAVRADARIAAVEQQAAQAPSFAEQVRVEQRAGVAILREHLGTYAAMHLAGAVHFFLDPGRFDLYGFFGRLGAQDQGLLRAYSEGGYGGVARYLGTQPVALVLLLGLVALGNLVKLAGLVAFARLRQVPGWVRAGLVALVGTLALLTGPLGAMRFALPVFPLEALAVLVVVGVLLERRSRPFALKSSPEDAR